jgi:hypothetical protein
MACRSEVAPASYLSLRKAQSRRLWFVKKICRPAPRGEAYIWGEALAAGTVVSRDPQAPFRSPDNP